MIVSGEQVADKALFRRHERIQARVGRRERVSPWVVWLVGLPAAALLGSVLHITGHGPFQALTETLESEAELEKEIVRLKQENKVLQEDINALMPGEFGIEKRAREQLDWSKPGEIIVRIPDKR